MQLTQLALCAMGISGFPSTYCYVNLETSHKNAGWKKQAANRIQNCNLKEGSRIQIQN